MPAPIEEPSPCPFSTAIVACRRTAQVAFCRVGPTMAREPATAKAPCSGASGDHVQAAFLHHTQPLEGGARRSLLADFPLLHSRHTGVQQVREDRLADPRRAALSPCRGRLQESLISFSASPFTAINSPARSAERPRQHPLPRHASNANRRHQVVPRRRAPGDQWHQRVFFRASTLAKASLRIALQSAGVSSLSAPLSPSSSFASSCSSALRFSSARISARIYSLTLL